MGRAEDIFAVIQERGESAIRDYVETRAVEELFLDFKQSSNQGVGQRLHDRDRESLAKAISGFGNSEGGVVVWGVDCSLDTDGADVARALVPVQNPQRFRSWLEGAVSGCTVPPHTGVRHVATGSEVEGHGYVATLIPLSNSAPHQVVGRRVYYVRAGSSFVPAPHGVLAGMFGRRPQPHVYPVFSIGPSKVENEVLRGSVGILIRNDGPGIASDLFINVWLKTSPGPNCELSLSVRDRTNWLGQVSFKQHLSLISAPGMRLPPEAHAQPIVVELAAKPPFTDDLVVEGTVGSGETPPYRYRLARPKARINDLWTGVTTQGNYYRSLSPHEVTKQLFGTEGPDLVDRGHAR